MNNPGTINFYITVPGKVILHGEHSVVYGKTALAASLNLKTKLKFTTEVENDVPRIILDFPCIEFNHNLQINDLQEFFRKHEVPLLHDAPHRIFSLNSPNSIDFEKLLEIATLFLQSQNISVSGGQENAILSFLCLFWGMFSSVDVPLPNCLIRITSELDIGAGMGSSTAFNISLAAAFLQFIRRSKLQQLGDSCEISKEGYKSFMYCSTDLQKFEKEELDLISQWGHFGDKIMHGNPSGIDNAVCTYGSVIEFRKGSHGPDIKIIPDPKFLKILLVNTKVPRNTKKLVSSVASLKDRLASVVEPILQAMDSVALSAAEILRRLSQISDKYDPPNSDALEETLSKEIEKLEELIDVNQKLLEALGVSHDTLEHICRIAKIEDLHGKLTGAGGGGYAFVMLPFRGYDKQLCAVKMSYEKHHFPVQQVTLGGPGVTLVDTFLSSTYEAEDSDSSTILSVEHPTHEGVGKMPSSVPDLYKQHVEPKEDDLDEWPWPFDLREVVRNMFETHINEDLQAGEIAIPLKSLCAVNIPEALPQWMDRVTQLQEQIGPTWKNVLQNSPTHRRKSESSEESETRTTQFGSVLRTGLTLPNELQQEKYEEPVVPSAKPNYFKDKVGSQATPAIKGVKGSIRRISTDLKENDPSLQPKPELANTEYHVPKQTSYREKQYGELNNPTKWLKDQFPPYGKREWKYGADVDENAKRVQSIQKKHKKFLRHQKPGCDHFRSAFQNEN